LDRGPGRSRSLLFVYSRRRGGTIGEHLRERREIEVEPRHRQRAKRRTEGVGLLTENEHELRLQEREDRAKLPEISRGERVGGRERRYRNPHVLTGERNERVVATVPREDDDGCLRPEPASKKPRGEPPNASAGLSV
jgi:hypothetical protein